MKILPNILGLLICLFYLLNWNHFILSRHAIVEHALTLFLMVIYYLYTAHTEFFISHITLISFLSAGVLLFKINFPIYLLMLYIAISINLSDISLFLKTLTALLIGLVFFESLQALILHRFGVLKWRYITLLEAIKIHSGKRHYVGAVFKPLGSKTLFVLLNLLAQWFGIKKELIQIKPDMQKENLVFFIILGILISYQFQTNAFVLLIFFTMCIVSFHLFFFYLKRMVFLIPILYLLFAHFIFVLSNEITFVNNFFIPFFILILTISIYKHISLAINGFKNKSDNLKLFAKTIDELIPDRQKIYCHGIAYRNLWQVKNHRLVSCDDDFMKNAHIIDRAIKEQARYVIISSGGSWCLHIRDFLKILAVLKGTSADTEVPEEFIICELNI